MARRIAYLIGNQNFRPDSDLPALKGPENDVMILARLLGDANRGGFDVQLHVNEESHIILPEIDKALSEASPEDLILIYYSGHGTLDRNGRLCLATANTRRKSLISTSIPTRTLRDLVDQSDCQQAILILDCCYSGAVDSGLKGAVGDELRIVEQARGFYIITASTATQVAKETTTGSSNVTMGRFTAALVEGLESGAADIHRKGKILLSDLRNYLNQTVTGQTPQFFDRSASGDPLISLSPTTTGPLLDVDVLQDLEAPEWHRRRGAVEALATVLKEGKPLARAAARSALEHRLAHERDYDVKLQIENVLKKIDVFKTKSHNSQSKFVRKSDRNLKVHVSLLIFNAFVPILIGVIAMSLVISFAAHPQTSEARFAVLVALPSVIGAGLWHTFLLKKSRSWSLVNIWRDKYMMFLSFEYFMLVLFFLIVTINQFN